jgi:uncharacterized protein
LRPPTQKKHEHLGEIIVSLGRIAVAYSGGVDSTLLLRVACDLLGAENVVAVVATSPTYPESECKEAEAIAQGIGVRAFVVDPDEMSDPNFVANPPDRCYHCKSHLLAAIRKALNISDEWVIAEGSNADDAHDFRPGRRAVAEQGVRSPLAEAGLTKAEIREISEELGLPTARKSAKACLASRIPYGTPITVEALKMIDEAESALEKLGFEGVRVRHHGTVARIEVARDQIPGALEADTRQKMVDAAKGAGFLYVTLDLEGYRTGSMNEVLASRDDRASSDDKEHKP